MASERKRTKRPGVVAAKATRCSVGSAATSAKLPFATGSPQVAPLSVERHSAAAAQPKGLAVCLGTSMQMTPARDWPCQADRLVIVNLQPTVKDSQAALVIRAPIDRVLRGVVDGLEARGRARGLRVECFQRREVVALSHRFDGGGSWTFQVADKTGNPCGFILHVSVRPNLSSPGL